MSKAEVSPSPSITKPPAKKRNLFGRIRHAVATSVTPKARMRWKALTRIGGYAPILGISNLSLGQKLQLIWRCFKVDWNILHGHRPGEIAFIFKGMAKRKANPGEVMVEAGCWNGGSSAKFSLMCALMGYRLQVFDSFQGVEPVDQSDYDHFYDFSGEYNAAEEVVRGNIRKYGNIEVCSFHPGWFKDSMQPENLPNPVHLVYIDCDLSKGTMEALQGVNPQLTNDAIIYSQDYHIEPVKELLHKPSTWADLKRPIPKIEFVHHHTAALTFPAFT